jgi:hypothetical protein
MRTKTTNKKATIAKFKKKLAKEEIHSKIITRKKQIKFKKILNKTN